MRRVLAAFSIALACGHAHAVEPIRLQVIPYQAGWGSRKVPVHDFRGTLTPPPALIAPEATTQRIKPKRRPKNARDADWDWLME